MAHGPITIDRALMSLDSPPVELEIVASSSSRVTPRPPAQIQAGDDGASDGGEGGAEEFKGSTDQELRAKIARLRSLHGNTNDRGEKSRKLVRRVEKELERRRTAGQRKVEMVRRQPVQTPSGNDPNASKSGDERNCSNFGGKHHLKSHFTPRTKNGKDDGVAFSDEMAYFTLGERARRPVNHESKSRTVCQNTTNNRLPDMDGTRLGLKICTKDRKKNSNVGPKGMSNKRHTEDDAIEIVTKRRGNSNNRTYQFGMVNKRNEKKEVVLLDDEDTEPAKIADVEMANEWDKKSEIYYPSRTDPESVGLTYSDIECLKPTEYLKSPVINFYIQYLKKSRPCDDLYIFSTYFYSKLEKALSGTGNCDSQFCKLRKWWRSVDIFKTPYVLLPIHGEMHWSLVIICMPAKEKESGPTVFHLDSLGVHSSDKIFDVIESYLKQEWSYLQEDQSYDIPFSDTIWRRLSRNIRKQKVEVPRQRNEYDCGIFMLYYIEKFIQEAPDRWTRERLCKFGRKWFNPEETSGLRERMRALLFDVFQNTLVNEQNSETESHSCDHSEDDDKDEAVTIIA
ncbi:ubiquitin-like-specific protease 1D [Lolium rigidum]|uniref:ubiquitin-like-specific protease 1D n=1 Tax=Lolium rigidum TaxID=89674 RepID=UPI001F5DAE7A|nr:ubiquitin-like-specific protease 1D [Lolium rigidum]